MSSGYQYVSNPANHGVVSMSAGVKSLLLHYDVVANTYLTVDLPPGPTDGDQAVITVDMNDAFITVQSTDGSTVVRGANNIGVGINQPRSWIYMAALNTWQPGY
ncbi:MAG: hypothetical protein P4L73_19720 [Caulobacteraceae bacterium]|nr:hypothetical protein [Caulobacteraceae bacterium]